MMKPVVRDAEVVFVIGEIKPLRVLTTPLEGRILIATQPRIQIGDRHVSETRRQQYIPVKLASTNNQHVHFPTENTGVDQPFQCRLVKVILFLILSARWGPVVHPLGTYHTTKKVTTGLAEAICPATLNQTNGHRMGLAEEPPRFLPPLQVRFERATGRADRNQSIDELRHDYGYARSSSQVEVDSPSNIQTSKRTMSEPIPLPGVFSRDATGCSGNETPGE